MLAKKYNVAETRNRSSIDPLEQMDPKNFDEMMNKLNKLESDRQYLIHVIGTLYIEIYMDQRFKSIVRNVKAVVCDEQYLADLKEDELKHKQQRRDLYKQLRQQRNHIKAVIYDSNMIIDDLRTKLEDLDLTESIRSRYVDNWQKARTEQNSQIISDEEYVHTSITENYKKRAEQEAKIHIDIEMLLTLQINETQKQVEEWMHKYETDLEAIDLKIQIKKIEYQDSRDKRYELEQMLEEHQKEMDDWISFKEERERTRLYRGKMMESAIMVQAWWRGLLVRNMLGPYRVRKGKRALKKTRF